MVPVSASVNLIATHPPEGASSRTSLRPRPSNPSQRTELRRLFRETAPDCTLQCGPAKRVCQPVQPSDPRCVLAASGHTRALPICAR